MPTEKDIIRCESIFNEERTHRFLWKRIWSKDKPLAAVIMLNPCQADNIITDTTSSLVVNNVARLEHFGGVIVVNLFSILTSKLNFRWNSDADLNALENDSYIRKAAEECEQIILAWGRSADTNKRIQERTRKVLDILKPFQDKLVCISDGERSNLHPLTPSLRRHWNLEHLDLEEYVTSLTDDEEQASPKSDAEDAPRKEDDAK
ncbi:MAG: DUF1643 domain-containing protein [Oscillospiraceae bacterium]|nr:DUF1643 domain-containing protein [Oscillospiraceae bacterium]